MTDRDFRIYRREFWTQKRVDGLRTAMKEAQRQGNPLAFYRYRDELEEFQDHLR